ncbi:MAG: hypothetical protein CCU26_02995 [Nitrospira sp. UW-LDO-01]|nr:MAG: hypothetical protein CCU26_02995 [Nitrospira sp. UW-LDO-01]
MPIENGCVLRIYAGETDKHNGRPLYEWIVAQAHARQLAGATVYRGLMGFGPHTRVIHTFKIERLAENLPITIEIIDSREKLDEFLIFLEQQVSTDLFTTVQMIEIRSIQGQTK